MTFLSIENPSTRKEAICHKVFDSDTGEEIPRVVWADDETGEYCQLMTDSGGNFLLEEDGVEILRRVGWGNIELRRITE